MHSLGRLVPHRNLNFPLEQQIEYCLPSFSHRATSALRLTFQVPKELREHMELLPKTAYIQAESQFSAQLKFLPRHTLPEDASTYFDKDTGVLEAPMIIRVADQVRKSPYSFYSYEL